MRLAFVAKHRLRRVGSLPTICDGRQCKCGYAECGYPFKHGDLPYILLIKPSAKFKTLVHLFLKFRIHQFDFNFEF